MMVHLAPAHHLSRLKMNRLFRPLAIIVLSAATALAASGGPGRLAKWHLEAIFSRIEEEVAAGPRLTTYAFAVVTADTDAPLSIRRITVSSFGRDVIQWDEETRKFRDLLEGARVSLTVVVPLSAVRRAEASGSGELAVEPGQIEIDAPAAPRPDEPPIPSPGAPSR